MFLGIVSVCGVRGREIESGQGDSFKKVPILIDVVI
jgi:hypothetical protein